MNFKEMADNGIASQFIDIKEYQTWLNTEAACSRCGAKYSDRPRDANGRCLSAWITETDCGCRHE